MNRMDNPQSEPGFFSPLFLIVRGLCLLGWMLGCLALVSGQARFYRYGPAEGLSSSRIRCLQVTQDGFLWAGTSDGLFRFDGYTFTPYRPDPDRPGSISSTNIYALAEDRQGYLWVATLRGGLNRYDPRTGEFAVFHHDPADSSSLSSDEVVSLHVDAQNRLWVGTARGLDRWDEAGRFIHYDLLAHSPDPERTTVFSLAHDAFGGIWAGMGTGLFRLDPATGHTTYVSGLALAEPPGWGIPTSMGLGPDSSLWIGIRESGLHRLRIRPGASDSLQFAFEALPVAASTQPGLLSAAVESLIVLPHGEVWAGTRRGLTQVQPVQGGYRFQSFAPDPADPHSLSYMEVFALTRDQAGNLWVGTADGLNLKTAHQPAFRVLPHREGDPQTLAAPYVMGVSAAADGRVWIALPTSIQIWDPVSGDLVTGYQGDRRMVQVFQDSLGGRWATCYGALMRLDAQGQVEQQFTYDEGGIAPFGTRQTMDALTGAGGQLWLSSFQGVLSFDPVSAGFTPYHFDQYNHFTQMVETDSGLLVGGQLGLHRLDLGQDSFYQVAVPDPATDLLAGQVIKTLLRSRDGTLYLGTREGLYRWHPAQGIWYHYREGRDLPNGVINTLLEDQRGRLWFSTNQGISCLDPATDKLRHFGPADGLPLAGFRNRSGSLGPGGWLYFGSNDGLVYFHPDSVRPNPYRPPVRLTSFRLFNREVPVGAPDRDAEFTLPQQIETLPALILDHHHRLFTLGFAALNYRHPEANRYAYRLLGFDTAWVYTSASERLATFTALAPGAYTFEVKAANEDGLWQETPTRLAIRIRPPWWRTGGAYLLYALALGSLAYGLLRMRIAAVRREERTFARIEQAKIEEREQVRARSSRDFHDEAGNRITKISLYASLLKQEAAGQPILLDMLDKVEANAHDLASGMRDFIWVLDPRFDSLTELGHRIQDFGQGLYDGSPMSFRYEAQVPAAALSLDVNAKRHLLMIAKEAMHNALKYAQAHTVWVRLGVHADGLYLEIQDDGLGFDPVEGGRQGHGLRHMQSRAAEMGATWKMEAVPGLGTHIRVERPL